MPFDDTPIVGMVGIEPTSVGDSTPLYQLSYIPSMAIFTPRIPGAIDGCNHQHSPCLFFLERRRGLSRRLYKAYWRYTSLTGFQPFFDFIPVKPQRVPQMMMWDYSCLHPSVYRLRGYTQKTAQQRKVKDNGNRSPICYLLHTESSAFPSKKRNK